MSANVRHAWVVACARVLAVVVIASGCEDDGVMPEVPGPSGTAPVPIVVEWQHPLPQGNDLRRMWGFADGSFYAVGDGGTVLHYDGATFAQVDPPTRVDLHGIWASGPDEVYVAGFGGTLFRYDGASWTGIQTPTDADFYAVWGSGGDDVFVTGLGGRVWNHTGDRWVEYVVRPDRRLRALWGYGHDEVYVAGSNGTLYRFDGERWTPLFVFDNPYYPVEIRDLWGPEPGAISCIDRFGILWFDGQDWSGIPIDTQAGYGLWGFSLDEQIGVSAIRSTHWVGGVRTVFRTPSPAPLFDVWGTAIDDCYAVGRYGNIAHFNGTRWRALNSGAVDHLHDIWVNGNGTLAVGTGGMILRGDGTSWVEEPVGSGYDLAGAWESGDGVSVAVGRFTPDEVNWRQAILVNTGASWVDAGIIGDAHRLFDVWGSSATDVYAVGWAGEILRFDGSAWGVVAHGNGDTAFLHGIDGTDADNIVVVGRTNDLRGLVCRFDGTGWRQTVLGEIEELYSVWVESETSAFAVGAIGAIVHYDGSAWSRMPSPGTETLLGVWGSSANDVYATGWNGTVLHFDGNRWTELLPATNRNLNAVSGGGPNEIYFAGDRGAILFFGGM